jgi:DNA modification methylase
MNMTEHEPALTRSAAVANAARRLQVKYQPIGDLYLDPKNARLHRAKQVRQIADSIKAFGFNVPILTDAGGQIIAGHGRFLAARRLGLTEAPTIRIEHLTAPQRRAFMIADNRLTEISQWDDRLLAEQLKELSELDLSFDLEATGFDIGEIDLRIESLSESISSVENPEETLPAISGPPVSRADDLWVLGGHKVLCGSALDEVAYATLIGPDQAAVAFTDPPYNVPIDGHVSGCGAVRHREFAMATGEMDSAGFTSFLETALSLVSRSSRAGALIYACMDWRHITELLAATERARLQTINLCVWTKPNAGMGSFYRSQHELVFVLKNGTDPHRNNVELGRHGRNRTNVWAYAAGPAFGRAGEEGRLAALHPTVKPVQMVADAILDSTRRGEIVLDPFLGSGTTLMAAERVGRRCLGLQIDPLYVDVIVRRWQTYSGESAIHAGTGSSFDETEAERTHPAVAGVR